RSARGPADCRELPEGMVRRGVMRLAWLLLPLSLTACATPSARSEAPVEAWLTTADRSALLAPQPREAIATPVGTDPITVDAGTRYQSIVGFGAAVTDASAYLIQQRMSGTQRDAL